MSKLNKIFYGPAGTGKTRKAIEEAVRIVNNSMSSVLNLNNYDKVLESFQSFSNLAKLQNKLNNKNLILKLQDSSIDIQGILDDDTNEGQLKYLTNGTFDKPKAKKAIEEYRAKNLKYPFIETVTFHPSYAYQDFVEGISVETTQNGQIKYIVKDGIFKKICDRAIENSNYNYVLIIDEINRGDISSIFGELFTLLEDTKRVNNKEVKNNEAMSINLPYSKDNKGNPKKLTVPSNLYIVATMNTVDKSIALIDVALRRRFEFEECMPQYNLKEFDKCKIIDLSKLLSTLNKRISILKNEHYQIGHSYFLKVTTLKELHDVMKKSIIPLLQEYFYDDWKSICAILNQSYSNPKDNKILISQQENKNLFKSEFNDLTEYQNKKIFKLNAKLSAQDIKSIYE